MSWMIELSCAILVTSVTEAVLLLLWYLAGWILARAGHTGTAFGLLKAILVPTLVPIAFWFLKRMAIERKMGRGYLFVATPALLAVSRIFLAVWGTGMAFFLLLLLGSAWKMHWRMRRMFPCTKEMEARLEEVYHRLKGTGKVPRLLYSYHFAVPCVAGILRPAVILPVRDYTEEELEIIYAHELTHCLSWDVAVKWLSLVVRAVYFFNPAAWLYCEVVHSWSEYACDDRACKVIGSMKRYFEVVAEFAILSAGKPLSPQLRGTQHELIDRMRRMKKYGKMKRCPTWTAGLLAAGVVLISPIPVYGAILGGVELYLQAYEMTEVGIEEEYVPPEKYEEYIEYGTEDDIAVRIGEVNEISRSGECATFEWNVGGREMVKSEEISLSEGDTVNIIIFCDRDDATLKVGLIQPNGTKIYVNVKEGTVSYNFSITTAGDYRLFVENTSKISVSVDGNYYVH